MLEESGDDGETADNDPGSELDVCPDTERDDVVAEIRGFGDAPGVVGSDDGGYASARNGV